jgi:hypothetical protein
MRIPLQYLGINRIRSEPYCAKGMVAAQHHAARNLMQMRLHLINAMDDRAHFTFCKI